ncbi:MAG: sugar transferase [Thermoguttaceae bacterium]|nr:sugar transferase [Thermoguttaceae bacterium]
MSQKQSDIQKESDKLSMKQKLYFALSARVNQLAALILLIPGLPIMLFLIILVHITSPGPAIYKQRRVGKDGKVFNLMKIRTMLKDAEAKTGPVWTAKNDPRITRLGRILRPLHLDELPQLFNVLMGQMALIGPRPERPEFTAILEKKIPGYMFRTSVLPGITGLAQINLPPDSDLDSVRRKLVLDSEYINNANLMMDLRIFFCTSLRIIGLPGKSCARVAGIAREDVEIPEYMRYRDDDNSDSSYSSETNSAKESDPPSNSSVNQLMATVQIRQTSI